MFIYSLHRADMPAPLAIWAADLGMIDMNIGGGPDYVPPAKNRASVGLVSEDAADTDRHVQ